MKLLRSLLLALLLPLAAFAQTGIVQSPAYKECIALSTNNPGQALVKAEEWLKIDASVAAYHCRAMALYGMRRYQEAGETLETTRSLIPQENISLRSFVTRQAAAAWKNASRADGALAILTTQLNEMNAARGDNALSAKLTADLLLDRARLNLTYGKVNLAAQDLDHAVSLTPLNPEILFARAQTFQSLSDVPLARADLQSVLTLNPGNAQARALLAELDKKAAGQP